MTPRALSRKGEGRCGPAASKQKQKPGCLFYITPMTVLLCPSVPDQQWIASWFLLPHRPPLLPPSPSRSPWTSTRKTGCRNTRWTKTLTARPPATSSMRTMLRRRRGSARSDCDRAGGCGESWLLSPPPYRLGSRAGPLMLGLSSLPPPPPAPAPAAANLPPRDTVAG